MIVTVGKAWFVNAQRPVRQSTAETIRETAAALERSEDVLHASAERSPDPAAARRLDDLGDAVTRHARQLAERAEAIDEPA